MDSDQPHRKPRKVKFPPKARARRGRSKTKEAESEENVDSVKAQEKDPFQRQQPKAGEEGLNLDDNGEQLVTKTKKYPWDYASYYPTILPWRRPNSGDTEILDEAEFGEASKELELDENAINPASELGLQDSDEASEISPRMFLMQFPHLLPVLMRFASAKGKEKEGISSQQLCTWDDLPAGKMGEILVYKSGAVKLKLGGVLYDVAPGTQCTTAQQAVTIKTEEKKFCSVGEIDNRAVVTPDVDDLLTKVSDLV